MHLQKSSLDLKDVSLDSKIIHYYELQVMYATLHSIEKSRLCCIYSIDLRLHGIIFLRKVPDWRASIWSGSEADSSSSSETRIDLRRFWRSCARAIYFSSPLTQYLFPFLQRPVSSTLLMIRIVFFRKLSKSSFLYQRLSPVRVAAAGIWITSASSLKVQLFVEDEESTVE